MEENQKFEIIEVYESNFISEIKKISLYLKSYPYISMDTEFPGQVYALETFTNNFYYKYIKLNVDKLNLIQLGITLFNEKGEKFKCWQFNLKFNINSDIHSNESILMLSNCGIDFIKLKNNGIPYNLFAEYFISSGLVLNEDITYISFNGFTDFAYLLKLCLNLNLPENEDEFINTLNLYFPNYYDIKILSNLIDNLKGGLNKIALQLGVQRYGEMHQAGSDSIITGDVFFQIKFHLNNLDKIIEKKNILFGIGKGSNDEETYQYTMFYNDSNFYENNNVNINNIIYNRFNSYDNFNNDNNCKNYFKSDDKVLQFIQKNGNFDSNHYNKYPWNMLFV